MSNYFSAQSYDRMLLIGVAYPLMAMFVIWVFNGGIVGPAEAALRFDENVPGWRRAIALISLLPLFGVSFLVGPDRRLGRILILLIAIVVAFVAAGAGAGAGAVAFVVVVAVVVVVAAAGVNAGALAIAIAAAGAVAAAAAGAVAIAIAIAAAAAGAAAGAAFLTANIAIRRKMYGKFLVLFSIMSFLFLLFALPDFFEGGLADAQKDLTLVLFLPLLTLVNAPFDWVSLGVTRRLLHFNLEKRGWWAVLISLADLFFAMLMVLLLSLSIVAVMQAFNASVIANGGAKVFDPAPVVSAIADPTTRWEPQYWWIYATLLSTFIPSLFNLAIGAMSLLRGIRPLRQGLLAKLPEEGQIHAHDRLWLPAALGAQLPIAIALACGAIWVVFQIASFCFGLFEANVPELVSAFAAQDYAGQFVRWIYS